MLTTLFKEIYTRLHNKKIVPIVNEQELEKTLEDYIMKVMGCRVRNEYLQCKESGNLHAFQYYGAVRRWLINLIQNFDYNKSRTVIDAIEEYGSSFYSTISNYTYVNNLITGIKKLYSSDERNPNIVIDHKEKMYKISLIDDKSYDGMPVMVINNIENLEKILSKYIEAVYNTDNVFKSIYNGPIDEDIEKKTIELLMWAVINVSNEDALDLERFFSKYTSFLKDDTFEYYKHNVRKLGTFLNDDLYLLERKSTSAYETPYYLAFMLSNRRVELPNIRIGIEDNGDNKTAHILSTQSTQMHRNPKEDPIINKEIRDKLPRSPYFREFNPSHLISIVITLGLLNGSGINTITAYEYLPMRYQKFVNEGRKNEEELYQYQHRLTNKFVNNFFRLMEFTDGIEIISYPENCSNLKISLNKHIEFSNDFLNEAYQLGYNQSENLKNKYKTKVLRKE